MSKKSNSSKMVLVLVVLLVAGAAWFGYSKQTATLENASDDATTAVAAPAPDAAIFGAQKHDIVLGAADAPATIIEYASLSCSHCAHFYGDVLPELKKEFIDTGKAKLVFRHFPLNAPALRAAQLVNCADDEKKESFLKVLFELQAQWAFNEGFLAQPKQIASVGGMDSAQFESCMADTAVEADIVEARRKGAEEAQVSATPTFYINGVKMDATPEIENFRAALKAVAE